MCRPAAPWGPPHLDTEVLSEESGLEAKEVVMTARKVGKSWRPFMAHKGIWTSSGGSESHLGTFNK